MGARLFCVQFRPSNNSHLRAQHFCMRPRLLARKIDKYERSAASCKRMEVENDVARVDKLGELVREPRFVRVGVLCLAEHAIEILFGEAYVLSVCAWVTHRYTCHRASHEPYCARLYLAFESLNCLRPANFVAMYCTKEKHMRTAVPA